MHTGETDPLPALVRPRALAQHYGVSRGTLYRWMQAGNHPRPVRLSGGVAVFRREDVEAFLAARAEAQPAGGRG